MNEIWRNIYGFNGFYQVSNFGNIKSIDRTVYRNNKPKSIKGKFIKQFLTQNGYAFVCLSLKGKKYNKRVHKCVAEEFIGEIKDGQVVHHKDHNKLNNHVENLEITSKQKNTQEYYKTLGKSMGQVPISHISKIQDRVLSGEQVYEIAKEYNVTRNDIAVLCKIVALTGEEIELKP